MKKYSNQGITRLSRRNFLKSVLLASGVFTVGAFVGRQTLLSERPAEIEIKPVFDVYPVTHNGDMFTLFMIIGQSLFPKVRQTGAYLSAEREIFKAVWEFDFFIYANDYAARFQKHYSDSTLIKPHDVDVREKYLAESIRSYPRAWSQIIYTMLTHSPEVLLAYLSQEKS